MANALDRVKAAEAKYAALVGTAEKLEATLKKFTGTAKHLLFGHHCVAKGDQVPGRGGPEGRALGFLVARVGGPGRWPSPWLSLEIFYGRGLCALLMLWGLGGEADANLSAACWCLKGAWENGQLDDLEKTLTRKNLLK